MAYQAVVFNVMFASPNDVELERRQATEVVHEWNAIHSQDTGIVLMPVGWETHSSPLLGERPQEIINRQVLSISDLLVAIFWTRLGTATGQAPSGTAEEIETHLAAGKPAMIYFSSAPVAPESVDMEQFQALQSFKRAISDRGLFEKYDSLGEFKDKFFRQLSQTVNNHPYFKSMPLMVAEARAVEVERPVRSGPRLSDDAAALLLEAAKDRGGVILRVGTFAGIEISTNGRDFVDGNDPRSEARWDSALEELSGKEMVRDKAGKGEVFWLTKSGYETADSLIEKLGR